MRKPEPDPRPGQPRRPLAGNARSPGPAPGPEPAAARLPKRRRKTPGMPSGQPGVMQCGGKSLPANPVAARSKKRVDSGSLCNNRKFASGGASVIKTAAPAQRKWRQQLPGQNRKFHYCRRPECLAGGWQRNASQQRKLANWRPGWRQSWRRRQIARQRAAGANGYLPARLAAGRPLAAGSPVPAEPGPKRAWQRPMPG